MVGHRGDAALRKLAPCGFAIAPQAARDFRDTSLFQSLCSWAPNNRASHRRRHGHGDRVVRRCKAAARQVERCRKGETNLCCRRQSCTSLLRNVRSPLQEDARLANARRLEFETWLKAQPYDVRADRAFSLRGSSLPPSYSTSPPTPTPPPVPRAIQDEEATA